MTDLDTDRWTRVRGPMGSNPGGIYSDERGHLHYLKYARSDDHACNEHLAARLYALAGVLVAPVRLARHRGRTVTVSPLAPGARPIAPLLARSAEARTELRAGFAVDAWLANWDVLGFSGRNSVDQAARSWT